MLDEYRIEPLSVGQYLDGVESERHKRLIRLYKEVFAGAKR